MYRERSSIYYRHPRFADLGEQIRVCGQSNLTAWKLRLREGTFS